MRILLDTNIIIDILTDRQPFSKNSIACYEKAILQGDTLFASTVSVADVMYITRTHFADKEEQLKKVSNFIDTLRIANITAKDFHFAFTGVMIDFEDALQAYCAKRHHIKYIITRNVKHFTHSPVKAVEPNEFLMM